jgi:hypothetical protein
VLYRPGDTQAVRHLGEFLQYFAVSSTIAAVSV